MLVREDKLLVGFHADLGTNVVDVFSSVVLNRWRPSSNLTADGGAD